MNPTEKLERFCQNLARKTGKSFSFKSTNISIEDAFSAKGILPAIVSRAQMICWSSYGISLDVKFKKTASTPLERELEVNSSHFESIRLLAITDTILELIRFGGREIVNLDDLLYEHIEIS